MLPLAIMMAADDVSRMYAAAPKLNCIFVYVVFSNRHDIWCISWAKFMELR